MRSLYVRVEKFVVEVFHLTNVLIHIAKYINEDAIPKMVMELNVSVMSPGGHVSIKAGGISQL